MTKPAPTEQDAVAVVRRCLGAEVSAIERFPTGLANYVYDVRTADGRAVAIRMNRPGQGAQFAAAAYWYDQLAPRGVPLPRLLHYDAAPADGGFPFMISDRLPGRDLGTEYPSLSTAQKRALAARLAEIQRAVGRLPPGPGFGFARAYDDRSLHATWLDVLRADLERSRRRIQAVGVVAPEHVDRVTAKLPAYAAYFAGVAPRPFLDDTTTKNVLVHAGRLSGIVDVDCVCFGDGLLTVALTRMALLSRGYDTEYVDYWCAELGLGAEERAVLTLYTALFCVNFLSELGHQFNREQAEVIDRAEVARLLDILDALLQSC